MLEIRVSSSGSDAKDVGKPDLKRIIWPTTEFSSEHFTVKGVIVKFGRDRYTRKILERCDSKIACEWYCAYIAIRDKDWARIKGKHRESDPFDPYPAMDVHGGCTYFTTRFPLKDMPLEDGYRVIGWDYDHYGDVGYPFEQVQNDLRDTATALLKELEESEEDEYVIQEE